MMRNRYSLKNGITSIKGLSNKTAVSNIWKMLIGYFEMLAGHFHFSISPGN
jgi:hypothetical protein